MYGQDLPRLNFTLLWGLNSDHLIAIEETHRIECLLKLVASQQVSIHRQTVPGTNKTYLPHGIDSCPSQLMLEVIPLNQSHPVLSCDSAFHLNGTFDHAMYDIFSRLPFGLVKEHDSWRAISFRIG
jgi:hypothetical protein